MKPLPPAEWKHVLDGPAQDYVVLKVREMKVESPKDGQRHSRVKIEAPDWVHVVATTSREQLLLIRQFRCGIWDNTLEIPGGMVDEGETPLEAARRELEEETGYLPKALTCLGYSHPNPALQNNRIWTFLASGCEKIHEGKPDVGEDIVVELYNLSEVQNLVKTGSIRHALVLAGLYLATLNSVF